MKPKYILENYDRILKEIKNPKIIFSNDLTPFLENFTSESFLIFQVDFIKKNGKTKYIIKNPIHNLHPKVTKLNFKESEIVEEFEPFIPKILDELNIQRIKVVYVGAQKMRIHYTFCKNVKSRIYYKKNDSFCIAIIH